MKEYNLKSDLYPVFYIQMAIIQYPELSVKIADVVESGIESNFH